MADTTPLERAARAAAEHHGENWDTLPAVNPIASGELDQQYFRDTARAVLTAIRVPSKAMSRAGLTALKFNIGSPDYDYVPEADHAADIFSDMIDAALAEEA